MTCAILLRPKINRSLSSLALYDATLETCFDRRSRASAFLRLSTALNFIAPRTAGSVAIMQQKPANDRTAHCRDRNPVREKHNRHSELERL